MDRRSPPNRTRPCENRKAVLGMLLERYPVEEIPEDGARNEFEAYVRRYDVPTDKRSSLGLRRVTSARATR